MSGESVFSEVVWLVFYGSLPEVFFSSGLSSSSFLAFASVPCYLSVAVGSGATHFSHFFSSSYHCYHRLSNLMLCVVVVALSLRALYFLLPNGWVGLKK